MTFTVPKFQNKHRLMAIAYGALVLAWLTPEDNTVIIVSVLGWGLSCLLVMLAVVRWLGGRTFSPSQAAAGMVIAGIAVGFGAVWCTMGLMIFKNAWHSHAYPDFATTVVVGIGRRLLAWTTAGGLLGGAAAWLRLGFKAAS